MQIRYTLAVIAILLLNITKTEAQDSRVQQGVLFKKGTSVRVANAEVFNKNIQALVRSNGLGVFTILASAGDTLLISGPGYTSQQFIVVDMKDVFIYLQPGNMLDEVLVTGKSLQQEQREIQDAFRSKGVYYGGKPPIGLLSPFSGSPLTFINEAFGKNAKRARRFNDFVQRESEYSEVAQRFSDRAIKATVPIKEEDLADFKAEYWPDRETLRRWNELDLLTYIKRSYEQFSKNRSSSDTSLLKLPELKP